MPGSSDLRRNSLPECGSATTTNRSHSGKKETGAQAALPIWLQFMQNGMAGLPVLDFQNVVPLEQQAADHVIRVDTPDTAPTEDVPSAPKEKPPAVSSARKNDGRKTARRSATAARRARSQRASVASAPEKIRVL